MTQDEIDAGGCPAYDIVNYDFWPNHTMCSDSTLEIGEWCESDGECGTDTDVDNCETESEFPLDIYVVRGLAISSCIDDGTITCGSGFYVDTERYCETSECSSLDTHCCNIPDQCVNGDYVFCPYHQFWEFDNNVTCETKRCQVDECCKDKAGCQDAEGIVTCTPDKFFNTESYCSDDVCDVGDDVECCTVREFCNNTGLICSDEDNYFLDRDIADRCVAFCTDAECCVERLSCANNTLVTCDSDMFLDAKMNCATDECFVTDTQCCQPKTNCDDSVICTDTTFSDPNMLCATDVCEQADASVCCQPRLKCENDGEIQCDSTHFIDTDNYCATDVCTSLDTQCCEPKAVCDDSVPCSFGEFSDPSILCTTDICDANDLQCCQAQALCNDDAQCGEDFYLNATVYCKTDTCDLSDTQCCETCISHSEQYPVEGVCPDATAPKDGSAQTCEGLDLDVQHRFEVAVANQLWRSCNSWCLYDLYSNGDNAFKWNPEEGCYSMTTSFMCFEDDERDYVLDNKMNMLCQPEPYDACAPVDLDNDCQIVWDANPVQNPWTYNRLISCHCPNELFWGFRDWGASTAVLCEDEGHGLENRLYLALANHAWYKCVSWCIFDVWEPETYVWMWDRKNQCYHQQYIDVNLGSFCAKRWHDASHNEYFYVKNITDRFCDEKDIEWALGAPLQSCSKRCGELSRSCDGEISYTINNSVDESLAQEYFSSVGVSCSDLMEGEALAGGTGYDSDTSSCVLAGSLSGSSYRDLCEVSPTEPTFQRLCACIKSPSTPSAYR